MRFGDYPKTEVKMKISFLLLTIFLRLTATCTAQFSLEKFFDEPIFGNYETLKAKIKSKNPFEEKIVKSRSLVYNSTIESIPVKVGYLFDDGSQKGKVITNSKEDEKNAAQLFDILLKALEKKFGINYSRNAVGPIIMVNWKGMDTLSIILSKKKKKTILTILKK